MDQRVADHVLQRLGEAGQPPEVGILEINVGNHTYLEVLRDEYFGRLLRQGASFKLVQGYFGAGKTHFLYCVRALAWEHGFATAVVELSPAECPYDDTYKVYRAVAARLALPPADPAAAPDDGIGAVIRGAVAERLRCLTAQLRQGGALRVDTDARRATETWLVEAVGRASCESHSYRRAVVELGRAWLAGDTAREALAEAWLRGEPIPSAQVAELGIWESISKKNGFTMLRCLTQMMMALEVPGTTLLFDEVDRNLSVGPRRSHIIGDNLRQVIDLCGRHQLPHTLVLYAVPPEFLRNVVPDYPALYQRLRSASPLSRRSPQAVLLDLERLDLAPEALLQELGERIVTVVEAARGVHLDRARQSRNASVLAAAAVQTWFEVNHRRLFVKAWVDLLLRQLRDGERDLTESEARGAIGGSNEALAATEAGGFDDC